MTQFETKILIKNKTSKILGFFLLIFSVSVLVLGFIFPAHNLALAAGGIVVGIFALFKALSNNDEKYLIINNQKFMFFVNGVLTNEFLLDDIESVQIFMTSYQHRYLSIGIDTVLTLKDGRIHRFDTSPSEFLFKRCPYQYLLDMIKIRHKLPNFQYTHSGENKVAEDLIFFEKNGKRMPSTKRTGTLITIMFAVIIFCLIFLIIQLTTLQGI